MRNTLETRLGLFFALCIVAAIIILERVGVADYFKRGYHVHADFKQVQDLKVGDPVKMAGVNIGRVDAIELTNDLVRVSMKIANRQADIRTDSKASVRFTGLMGANYVAISFGSPQAPRAVEGFPLATLEQPDLNTLLVKLESTAGDIQNLTKSMSAEGLSPLFGPLTGMMSASSNDLVTTIGNLRKVTDDLAQGKGTIGKLISDDTLYTSAMAAVAGVQASATELKAIALDARSIVGDINAGKGNLGLLVRDDALYRESTNAMVNIREIMQKVNRGDGTVGKLINDESFYKNAKVSLQKLDKATESLEDTGPLSVLGTAVGSLF